MSSSNPFLLVPGEDSIIQQLTIVREGETKIGQTIKSGSPTKDTKIVLLGIEEAVGPQANLGNKGAENAFPSFFKRFLNMQDNAYLSGNTVCYLGKIIQQHISGSTTEMREDVEKLDRLVQETLQPFFSLGYIVLVIGGGHNNAYPLIHAAANSINQPIDVINLDPHADCRKNEGRHSGNSFSIAYSKGLLNKYNVIGLHKAYNSSYLLNQLQEMKAFHTFFESYLLDSNKFKTDVLLVKESVKNIPHGIELDLDAIAFMPSSAFTPSGFSIEQARWYLRTLVQPTTRYIHLTEGAPCTSEEEKIVGKTLAYLASDILEYVTCYL